jgi:divalent metal cation (Fe/Co/Zn/Cd) transporter
VEKKRFIKIDNIKKEIKRLGWPLLLFAFWLLYWGIKDGINTASILTGFLGLAAILAHFISKNLFGKYNWDVGEKLNEAWKYPIRSHAILAVGMLMARVFIYISVIISMALILNFLRGGFQ